MKTTLNRIKAKSPCASGYWKLLRFLGKTKADDEPLDLSVILESNGVLDAVWCFRAVSGFNKEKRLFAVFCARQHLLTDPRSINAIEVSERYAHGNATAAELKTARIDAAYSDSAAAYVAAYSAAYDAAYSAAYAIYFDDPNILPVLEAYLKSHLSVK